MRSQISFFLNGKRHDVSGEKAGWMLADYLRYELSHTGTKIVCAEGDCGACTILRSFPLQKDSKFLPVNSCITTVAQMDGSSIVSVDALAKDNQLTPVQSSMQKCHGSQCGFCTPGFVMALTGLVEKKLEEKSKDTIEKQEAKNCMTGNLCRCTGYEPILDAAQEIDIKKCESIKQRFTTSSQDKDLKKIISTPVKVETEKYKIFAPRSLKEASSYLLKNKDARILSAGTDLGVVHNKRKIRLEKILSLHLIPELYEIKTSKAKIQVGARVTLSELRNELKGKIEEFVKFLDLFASPQIKNVATLIGNVCNASPIADTPPFLLAANATVHTHGPKGRRKIPLQNFYLDYRKTALKAGEIATAIEFDIPSKDESFKLYKVSQRKDLDISTVNAAFRVRWKGKKIEDLRIALGGMAATPIRLLKTEKLLKGNQPDATLLTRALQVFHAEMKPISDLRGSGAFRRVASENLFHKFFSEHVQ